MSRVRFGHHHGAMSVPSLATSIEWYRRVLGFEVERHFPVPAVPAEVAILRNGDLRLEILQAEDAKPLPQERREPNQDLRTHGNKHIAFVVEDANAFAEELKRRGADIVSIKRFPFGANIFIRDAAGNLIEFVEGPLPAGEAAWIEAESADRQRELSSNPGETVS